jgi:predicted nucleic acid-binding protein
LRIYLDASVLIAVLAEEPASAAARRFLRAHREDRLISDFAAAEVASATSRLL